MSNYPPSPADPTAEWEKRRQEWLRPKSHPTSSSNSSSRKPRSVQLSTRMQALEELLSLPFTEGFGVAEDDDDGITVEDVNGGADGKSVLLPQQRTIRTRTSTSESAQWTLQVNGGNGTINGGTGKSSSGGSTSNLPLSDSHQPAGGQVITSSAVEVEEEADEFDGGQVIRKKEKKSKNSEKEREELEKVTNGILNSFKAGRELRDPLPLSLVTKLLYRSWTLDGTIPRDYLTSSSLNQLATSTTPHTTYATSQYATATSPTAQPIEPEVEGDEEEEPDLASQTVDGAGLEALKPKMKMDALKGSLWRSEKDVASGSDVI